MRPAALCSALGVVAVALTGCGAASPGCVSGYDLRVSPAATADCTAVAPGNQQQFIAGSGVVSLQGNCPIPQIVLRVNPTWTNPDPIHIAISSADDYSNGLATCKGPTAGPVTLTATTAQPTTPPTASVQLTCR